MHHLPKKKLSRVMTNLILLMIIHQVVMIMFLVMNSLTCTTTKITIKRNMLRSRKSSIIKYTFQIVWTSQKGNRRSKRCCGGLAGLIKPRSERVRLATLRMYGPASNRRLAMENIYKVLAEVPQPTYRQQKRYWATNPITKLESVLSITEVVMTNSTRKLLILTKVMPLILQVQLQRQWQLSSARAPTEGELQR